MKQILILFVFVSGTFLPSAYAAKSNGYHGFQPATVVSIDRHETEPNSNYAGSNPSDAPLQSAEVYSYDIGIRLGCTVYRARYDSAFESLPTVFSVNHPIEVNLHKRVIEVSLPGNHAVRMDIGSRSMLTEASCRAGS
jgi:hypothetical protein